MISKMVKSKNNASSAKESSNMFPGGFKYRPNEAPNIKPDNNLSKLTPSQLDKFTVYDEFGIINDSIAKKKYR